MPFRDRIYAEVTDNEDPENRRRIKARCPALVREDAEIPFWIEVASLGRIFEVPAVGARVELLIRAGQNDIQDFVQLNEGSMRWLPAFQDKDTIPQEVLDNYFDAIAMWAPDGSFVLINKESGDILVVHKDGNRTEINAEEIFLIHKNGNRVDVEDGEIRLTHKGGDEIKLDGTNITLNGDSKLGNAATYFIVRGDKLNTYLTQDQIWKATHQHPTAAPGAPSPPSAPPPTVPGDLLSTTQKTE